MCFGHPVLIREMVLVNNGVDADIFRIILIEDQRLFGENLLKDSKVIREKIK